MKRALPWIIAAVLGVAFLASFSEMQRVKKRFGEMTVFHFDARKFTIHRALKGADRPVVFLGDSITEWAKLPATINGRPVINAGIGGVTISDMITAAPIIFEGSKPALIVVALGTNDSGAPTIQVEYAALLSQLKEFSPNLVALAVPSSEIANGQIQIAAREAGATFIEPRLTADAFLEDGVHLSAAGYRAWLPAVIAAISGPDNPTKSE